MTQLSDSAAEAAAPPKPADTIASLLVSRAADDHRGLLFEDASWTWREVVQASADRAALLAQLRRPGPFHIGVLLENVPEYSFLLGAAALAGATVVGLNPTRRGEELERDIRHTDCQLVLTDGRKDTALAGLELGLPADRIIDVTTGDWSALLDGHRDSALPTELPGPDALFVLIFTSGSTAAPKAVKCTQGRQAKTASMPFSTDDVLYSAMPLFHGNALASCWTPAIGSGATLVLRRTFSASGFLPDVLHYGVTFFNTVGRALGYILAVPPSPDEAQTKLKWVLAPESSPRDTKEFSKRFRCGVVEGYGSSEGAIQLYPGKGTPRGALGQAMGSADIAIINSDTRQECPRADIDPDTGALRNADEAIGELVRRDDPSRSFEGYYNNPEAMAERTRSGWFWSGDLAYRDPDGNFFFAGRVGDWVRVDSENFSAAPVERILDRFVAAATVAVYGVPDPTSGDQLMVALELTPGAEFDPAAFSAFLAAQPDLGTKGKPRLVRLVQSMPVTATNKINKRPLRTERWNATDPIWWRPDPRSDNYVRFTTEDAAAMTDQFATNGRLALLR
jgi:fatty-acyl-CoA synthase